MVYKIKGNKSVVSALFGNSFVTLIKGVVALSSGSVSLFAESIHSLADTLNQSLLLVGLKRSKKPADNLRGYGYGIERFFWSLISACGILFIGAGVTIYHSINSLIHINQTKTHVSSPIIISVLLISLLVEGITLFIALRELKGRKEFSKKIFKDADPVTLAVVYEDGAAVFGVIVALIAQLLIYFTNNFIYDAIGGIIIGLILGFLAIILIVKNHQYIIGKSLEEETKEKVIELLLKDPCIEKVLEFKSVAIDVDHYRIYATVEWNGTPLYKDIYEAGDLKEEFDNVRKDFRKFIKMMFATTDRIPRLVGSHIDEIEKTVRKKFPQIVYVDIEIN